MSLISLVFPHQLFLDHPALSPQYPVYIVEEWLFFREFPFHKQKLLLHRAAMQYYAALLQGKGFEVVYIASTDERADIRKLLPFIASQGQTTITIAHVYDNWLMRRLEQTALQNKLTIYWVESPYFLNSTADNEAWAKGKKRFFHASFYQYQRQRLQLLVDDQLAPLGGKWSFDEDNRKKYPAKQIPPKAPAAAPNQWIEEAKVYVEKHFSDNPGLISGPHRFVVTHEEAQKWLLQFLKERLLGFGVYEDAIHTNHTVLHHSLLTPMLNIGLLTPQQIVDATLQFAADQTIPMNDLEGFIRQIIGWREFMRLVYESEGSKQRTTNFWQFKRNIPSAFWTGETGIVPIDHTIKQLLETGYCHHIERLMLLGNFMVLSEFDPDEVYHWFMSFFIDAYDWVMVPNVYGMSQFADGGLLSTKPYISSSNYVMKMSNYQKGSWQNTWDALFWRFLMQHKTFFKKQPRMNMLVQTFEKMTKEKQDHYFTTANTFLQQWD